MTKRTISQHLKSFGVIQTQGNYVPYELRQITISHPVKLLISTSENVG